jgi:hypothetical protein
MPENKHDFKANTHQPSVNGANHYTITIEYWLLSNC